MFVPRVVYALLVLAAFTTLTHAQAAGTGFPLFNSFAQHGTDTINEGNLNVHIEIPIFTKAGRGLPVNYVISYDALNWYAVLSPTNNVYYWTWPGTGWHLQPISGYVTWVEIDQTHACNGLGLKQRTNYVYHDPSGGVTFLAMPRLRKPTATACRMGLPWCRRVTAPGFPWLWMTASQRRSRPRKVN